MFFPPVARVFKRADTIMDRVLHALALYLLPAAVVIVSIIGWISWSGAYEPQGAESLRLHVLKDERNGLSPVRAAELLAERPDVSHFETRLSEAPFWFSLEPQASSHPLAIEFPSRHGLSVSCWDAESGRLLGEASRSDARGAMSAVKAGFALHLAEALPLVCRATFTGPARLTAVQWPATQLQLSADQYHRQSGLLDGGLLLLAVFVSLMALINRQGLYVLFAVWLVCNLRVAALSAGMDFQWLGLQIPPEWLSRLRSLTMTSHGVVTLLLFQTLFKDAMKHSWLPRLLQLTLAACLPLALGALFLPYRQFLPLLWTLSVVGFVLMVASLVVLVATIRTSTVAWYAASLGITLFSAMAEVIAAAVGKKELALLVNSVTGAIASSVLTAVAIAEQIRNEHEQRLKAQAKLQRTFDAMPVGLFSLLNDGTGSSANPALYEMLGTNAQEFVKTQWSHWFGEQAWVQMYRLLRERGQVEMELAGKHGERRFQVSATFAHGVIEGSLQDVTRQSLANEHMRFLAHHDPLTKILNRRGVESAYMHAMGQTPPGRSFILAYLDLDRFKLINELFGHAAGDEVLRQVCDRVGRLLTEGQKFGRVGGDEFVLLMPDTSVQLAELICRGVVDQISQHPFQVGDKAFQVRGSIGAVEVSPGSPIKDALSAADTACRSAKRKQSVVICERGDSVFEEHEAELALMEQFSIGRITAGLYLEMQPIMSLTDPRGSLNMEVLLRMRNEQGQNVPVGRLLSAAESSGRTAVIDRWVMTTTLTWIRDNWGKLSRNKFVCMNLSGASLNDERFVADALDLLARFPLAASRLCIEVTESVALHDLEITSRFIHSVRKLGARVALDDFGAGYTSFSYLKQLRADVLKIDGSFIVDINADPANVTIVEAIVTLARNLGMKVIAEWAEDAETVRTLAEIGVDYVQGYAVARSQAPERILDAQSSADFILDGDTRAVVETLIGQALQPVPEAEARLQLVQ